MSEDKMIGMIDAKYRRKNIKKKSEWGIKEYRNNPDGSVQGYEEYTYYVPQGLKIVKGVVRWWRKSN